MKRHIVMALAVSLVLSSCGAGRTAMPTLTTTQGGMGMGRGGMGTRHHATIPDPYAGMTNPDAADDASLARGAEIYAANCTTCHGDGGMGDGPSGTALDPVPAPIAHTSQMMGDDYLFWRISEGGTPFGSAMLAYKESLDEQARWDVINYIRALGSRAVTPGQGMSFDPAMEAEQRAAMLAGAVAQGVITQEEAAVFDTVHSALDAYLAKHPEARNLGSGQERMAAMLSELVQAGTITQAQADGFLDVHDRLIAANLME